MPELNDYLVLFKQHPNSKLTSYGCADCEDGVHSLISALNMKKSIRQIVVVKVERVIDFERKVFVESV